MKSLKTILLATTLTAGFGLFLGASDAHADSLYTVKAGDTLSSISYELNGDFSLIEIIASDNNISDINLIYSGEELTIRTSDEATTTSSTDSDAMAVVEQTSTTQATTEVASTTETTSTATTTSAAKEWIAQKESGGSYTATNGRYIGRYQLDSSYLNGDYSAENQERVADSYVAGRYGSWEAAQAFWIANGWY